jgi:hypothetical protein
VLVLVGFFAGSQRCAPGISFGSSQACRNHTRACRDHTHECHNHTHTCQKHTLHVRITLVRVEITVDSVLVIFLRVKITLRVEITLCVCNRKSACINHT